MNFFKIFIATFVTFGSLLAVHSAQAYSCNLVLPIEISHSDYFTKLLSEANKGSFGKKIKEAYSGMKYRKAGERVYFKPEELDLLASYSIKLLKNLTASQLNSLIGVFKESAKNFSEFYNIPDEFAREWDYEVSQRWIDQIKGDDEDLKEGFRFSAKMAFHTAFNRSTFRVPLMDKVFVQSLIDFLSLRTVEGYLKITEFNKADLKRLNLIFSLYPESIQSDEFRNDMAMGLGYNLNEINMVEGYDASTADSGVEIPFLGSEVLENFDFEDDRLRLRHNEWY